MSCRNSLWAIRHVALGASRATAITDSWSDGCHAGIQMSTAAGYSSPGGATPITRYALRPYGSISRRPTMFRSPPKYLRHAP
jgi:hypothetical protein